MPMIYVRTKPGRKLFYEGKPIPHENFIAVTEDRYIRRLIDHWGDLEEEGGGEKKKEAKAKPKSGEHGQTPRAAAEPYQPVTKN